MFLIQPTDSSFLASSRLTMNIIDPAIELPIFMMSFFLWYVVFLSESESVQVFLFFVYICIVIGEPITGADPGFQVRRGAFKKIAPSGGRREIFGVFRVKNHDFTPKNHIWIRP